MDCGWVAEYLGRAQALDLRINSGMERIEELRALAQRRTAAYGVAPARGGCAPDRRMDVVARIVDAERALDLEIDRMLALKREIAGVIERVADERLRAVLELRYLNGLTWEQIGERMGYTARNARNLHAAALRCAAALLPRPGAARCDPGAARCDLSAARCDPGTARCDLSAAPGA